MSGEDKSLIYKTLNECVALLNNELTTGQVCVYATMDRVRHAELLRQIVECQKALVRTNTREFGDG